MGRHVGATMLRRPHGDSNRPVVRRHIRIRIGWHGQAARAKEREIVDERSSGPLGRGGTRRACAFTCFSVAMTHGRHKVNSVPCLAQHGQALARIVLRNRQARRARGLDRATPEKRFAPFRYARPWPCAGRHAYRARDTRPRASTATPSLRRRPICSSRPPPSRTAIRPGAATTRCQGTPSARGECRSTNPTSRARRGRPAARATSP